MVSATQKTKETIEAHGGELINLQVTGQERAELIEAAQSYPKLTLNPWSLSDLELIAIGGFSPLTGFLGEKDYISVVENLRLENGLVWSIPITLPVTEEEANNYEIGSDIALYGEYNHLYGVLKLEEKYTYDKAKEAQNVYGTTDVDHPGVKRVYEKGNVYLAGPIQLVDPPKHDEFSDFHL